MRKASADIQYLAKCPSFANYYVAKSNVNMLVEISDTIHIQITNCKEPRVEGIEYSGRKI